LATSRFSSNNPDWIDIVEVMAAFEEMNGVVLTLTGRVGSVAGQRSLMMEVQAHDKRYEIGEAPTLASVRCHPGSSNHRSMESAIMWALYQLDGQLAAQELVKEGKTA
jgi:hypothetical protein